MARDTRHTTSEFGGTDAAVGSGVQPAGISAHTSEATARTHETPSIPTYQRGPADDLGSRLANTRNAQTRDNIMRGLRQRTYGKDVRFEDVTTGELAQLSPKVDAQLLRIGQ